MWYNGFMAKFDCTCQSPETQARIEAEFKRAAESGELGEALKKALEEKGVTPGLMDVATRLLHTKRCCRVDL